MGQFECLKALIDGPKTIKEVAALTGVLPTTASASLQLLFKRGLVCKFRANRLFNHGCHLIVYYYLSNKGKEFMGFAQ